MELSGGLFCRVGNNVVFWRTGKSLFMLPKGVHIEGVPSELEALLAKDAKAKAFRTFIKGHSRVIWIGLVTGGAIILFQVINLFVIYRYLKLDYYLCLVAICFGVAGWMLNKRRPDVQTEPILPLPGQSREDLLALLTSKEVLVLRLLAESKTNKEIAAALFVEVSTIKTHVNNIYSKLSVSNRKEARSKYAEMAQRFPIS
jgi:DNA-binding CsgD family transcriptional regulator